MWRKEVFAGTELDCDTQYQAEQDKKKCLNEDILIKTKQQGKADI